MGVSAGSGDGWAGQEANRGVKPSEFQSMNKIGSFSSLVIFNEES